MRILHVITALHTGGAERMLADLSHNWAAEAELHVAYIKPVRTLAGRFHPATTLHEIGLDAGTAGRLRALVKRLEPAVVHTHLVHADFFGLWAARGLARRWLTLHNAHFRTGPMDSAFQIAYRLLLGTAAKDAQAVAISEAVARHAHQAWHMAPARVHTLRNPLAVPGPALPRHEARARLGLSPNEPALLFLGRLEPQKGLSYLLQALARLHAEGRLPVTYIVGEGSLSDALAAEAQALGLAATGQVRFTGLTSEPGLYLSAADALVLPSLFEGLGNVIAEAFAFGLPVVASDIEGPAEIVRSGETGLLVPPRDPAALAKALRQLLTDTVFRGALSTAASLQASAWPTPAAYAQALLELYRRA